jgi:hypothetical protein
MIYNNTVCKKPRKVTDVKEPRFTIVRNTSRRTGECSWGILDNRRYDNTNPVVYIADNLKDALLECDRLSAPPEKIKYTKHGQIGFVTNDEVEDDEYER